MGRANVASAPYSFARAIDKLDKLVKVVYDSYMSIDTKAMTKEALLEKWQAKAKNIRWLKLDIAKLTGYELADVDDAIADYEDIDRDDYDDIEEYKEEKAGAWQDILGAIDDIEVSESEQS